MYLGSLLTAVFQASTAPVRSLDFWRASPSSYHATANWGYVLTAFVNARAPASHFCCAMAVIPFSYSFFALAGAAKVVALTVKELARDNGCRTMAPKRAFSIVPFSARFTRSDRKPASTPCSSQSRNAVESGMEYWVELPMALLRSAACPGV